MIYFGTDGIRGIVGQDLTQEICFKCGNAIAKLKSGANILIGTDTRTSASFLLTSFASGATMGGANICFVGIVPTPAISFLVQKTNADFGVMLTASHNPPEYNGIKVFDKNGKKIDTAIENEIERNFASQRVVEKRNFGKFLVKTSLASQYQKYLKNIGIDLSGLKIVVDASNGANFKIAQKVFKSLNANCHFVNCKNDGKNINNACGALYPQKLAHEVTRLGADVGFAFDGDADRIVAVDEKGNIIDGDQILLFLTKMYMRFSLLHTGAIVATVQSNVAFEKQIGKFGLKLLRTDVGDKNVINLLLQKNLQIGGEQAGHIILTDYSITGDGLLTAVIISKFLKLTKEPFSKNLFFDLYKQEQKNIVVSDKYKIINSAKLKVAINECEQQIAGLGRILVRASGTEPKIRVMVECSDSNLSKKILDKICKKIVEIE